jgi:hypothetical protein
LAFYYKEQIQMGVLYDLKGVPIPTTHHICRLIVEEMQTRGFSENTRREVYKTLGDEFKRGWRQPITVNGKVAQATIEMDAELSIIFNEMMEHANEIGTLDYNEFPKPLKVSLAERVYQAYKHNDKEWSKHDLQVVKHQADGYYVADRFPDIIRIEETEPYEGELYDRLKGLRKTISEMMKKVKTQRPPTLTLEMEHRWAMGVAVLDGYLKPWGNFKWKKEVYGWSKIIARRLTLRNKCAAAKSSRIPTNFDDVEQQVYRGITREEIDKNQKKLIKFFQQFIEHFPGLIEFAQSFDGMTATYRARHSVNLHEKLSHNS